MRDEPEESVGQQTRDESAGVNQLVGVVLRSRAKTIHFIRHAEGMHNKAANEEGYQAYLSEEYFDARLTEVGKQQCAELKENCDLEKEAQLVVVSTLTRAIQTAVLSMEQLEGVPWIALECVREQLRNHPCNNRRPVHALKEEFPMINFDEIVDDEDKLREEHGNRSESEESLENRAREMLAWLKPRPEMNIVVVTHGLFLDCLFNKVIVSPSHLTRYFLNCECRTVLMDL